MNLAPAIAASKTLVAVDMSQNGVTPRCADAVAEIISENISITDLNLGSTNGAQRNRLGAEGGKSVAYGFTFGRSIIQFLSLRSVTLGNDELESLVESLENYMCLTNLDLS